MSLTGRSLVCNRSAGNDEIVSADWLTYYIQVSLSVKGFSKVVLQFPAMSCRTNFVLDSERQLYVLRPMSQGGFRPI